MTNLSIQKEAASFKALHVPTGKQAINPRKLLKDLGVITVFKPLKGNFSGMALKVNDHRFMMINSEHPVGKQNFTILHELYHLYIQKDFTAMFCYTENFSKSGDKNELYADLFASYLLLPEDGILLLIPNDQLKKDKIQLSTIVQIEQFFQCSRTALLFKLREMELLSEELRAKYNDEVIKSARAAGFTADLYQKTKNDFIGENYVELAKELYDKELISESHYLSMMLDAGFEDTNT